jgi:hypothetical protein
MLDLLYKWRLPLLQETIETVIPNPTAQAQIQITQTMPTQIGLIIGMSVETGAAGQVSPANRTLLTPVQASQLYLQMKQGQSDFLSAVRLSNLIFKTEAVFNNPYNFQPLNIPATVISLDKSVYLNPTNFTAANTAIVLNFWYITIDNVNYLVEKGAIAANPFKQPGNFKTK